MALNFKKGGDVKNQSAQTAAGGVAGTGVALDRFADADASNIAVQQGTAEGTVDDTIPWWVPLVTCGATEN
ncbi:MAG: hypothetical protein M3255_07110 [Pseudomonadota bacterium]|jgi:hypothetical protein|nr:hypothetical protein [Pseudomonadota bacterium]